jgi:gluconolactonase
MKRTLSLLLVLPLATWVFACKDSHNGNGTANNTQSGSDGGGPGGSDGTGQPTAVDLNTNPIEGIAPAKAILEAGEYTDGPVWQAQLGVLFFTTPLGEGALYRMLPDGRVLKLRDGSSALGTTPIGNTVLATGDLITLEAKRVTRSAVANDAGPQELVIATGYGAGAAPPPDSPDGGIAAPTAGQFDTLKGGAARKDGHLYVTDPGYFTTPIANRIYHISPSNKVDVSDSFDSVPRPNGIVLSPDEKTLYVGFTNPEEGVLPFIRQYIVNADGSLGEWTKFADIGPQDSSPDGLATDMAGNIYVCTKAGVEVYKAADATKWGVIAVPEKPTGAAFGGKDMKTLFITTEGVKIWEVTTKLAGVRR